MDRGPGSVGELAAWCAHIALLFAAGAHVATFAGTTTYSYDTHGRLKETRSPSGSDQAVITNSFDNADNRLSVVTGVVDTTPPNPPTGLGATAQAYDRIQLTWTASTDLGGGPVSYYKVYRSGSHVASPAGSPHDDQPLAANTPYSYKVSAVDPSGNESAQSNQASATTPPNVDTTPPSVPQNVQGAAISGTWVNLTWNASQDNPGGVGLGGYQIFRDGGSIGFSTVASFSDQAANSGVANSYQVRAYDVASPANYSALSSPATNVTPPDTVAPGPPGNPTFANITATTATANWTAASDNVGVTGYRYSLNGGGNWTTLGNVLTASLGSLTPSTQYTLLLQARDSAGNWGSSSSGIFTTSYPSDTANFVGASTGDGVFYQIDGYNSGVQGSLTPNTITGGKTVTQFWAYYDLWTGSGSQVTLQVTGFSGNPGQGWLQSISIPSLGISYSGAGASFACANSSTCTWTWNVAVGNFWGSGQLVIVHQ